MFLFNYYNYESQYQLLTRFLTFRDNESNERTNGRTNGRIENWRILIHAQMWNGGGGPGGS